MSALFRWLDSQKNEANVEITEQKTANWLVSEVLFLGAHSVRESL